MHARAFVIAATVATLASACAATPPSTDAAPARVPPIALVHQAKCGGCHEAPQPGSRERAKAAAAMNRHEKRLRLTNQEWKEMVDYLSTPNGAQAKTAADTAAR